MTFIQICLEWLPFIYVLRDNRQNRSRDQVKFLKIVSPALHLMISNHSKHILIKANVLNNFQQNFF